AHDHIGRIGVVVLQIEPGSGRPAHGFRPESKQTQLLRREAAEQPYAGQNTDVLIQRHGVPGKSVWRSLLHGSRRFGDDVKEPAYILRFLSQVFPHWKDRVRSSVSSGTHAFPAYAWSLPNYSPRLPPEGCPA